MLPSYVIIIFQYWAAGAVICGVLWYFFRAIERQTTNKEVRELMGKPTNVLTYEERLKIMDRVG